MCIYIANIAFQLPLIPFKFLNKDVCDLILLLIYFSHKLQSQEFKDPLLPDLLVVTPVTENRSLNLYIVNTGIGICFQFINKIFLILLHCTHTHKCVSGHSALPTILTFLGTILNLKKTIVA